MPLQGSTDMDFGAVFSRMSCVGGWLVGLSVIGGAGSRQRAIREASGWRRGRERERQGCEGEGAAVRVERDGVKTGVYEYSYLGIGYLQGEVRRVQGGRSLDLEAVPSFAVLCMLLMLLAPWLHLHHAVHCAALHVNKPSAPQWQPSVCRPR